MKCKRCLITNRIENVEISSDRECNYCSGTRRFGVLEDQEIYEKYLNKSKYYEEFQSLITSEKGSGEFDCIVALSGGKDSAYLLYYLKKNTDLRILTLTIDTGFESKIALKNIGNIIKKLNVNHILIQNYSSLFKKVYRYLFSNFKNKNTVHLICDACTGIWHSILIREASIRKIPMVFLAYSPEQVENYFFEIPGEKIKHQQWYPDYINSKLLTHNEMEVFWNYSKESEFIPRVILPFHVFPEYSPKNIRKILKQEGIIPNTKSGPEVTNCYLNWLMIYRDLNNLGYNPYLESFSYNIRNGSFSKIMWNLKFSLGNFLIKRRLFPRKIMKKTLKILNLTFKDLIK